MVTRYVEGSRATQYTPLRILSLVHPRYNHVIILDHIYINIHACMGRCSVPRVILNNTYFTNVTAVSPGSRGQILFPRTGAFSTSALRELGSGHARLCDGVITFFQFQLG